jgi:hypothetical protein
MKDLFNSSSIVVFFKTIFKYIDVFHMFLLPFYVLYGFCWGVMILISFVTWKLPLHIPMPFVGNLIVDRVLLLIGLIIAWGYYINEYKDE